MSLKSMTENPEVWKKNKVPEEERKLRVQMWKTIPRKTDDRWYIGNTEISYEDVKNFFKSRGLECPDRPFTYLDCVPRRRSTKEYWYSAWGEHTDDEAEAIWTILGLKFPGKDSTWY